MMNRRNFFEWLTAAIGWLALGKVKAIQRTNPAYAEIAYISDGWTKPAILKVMVHNPRVSVAEQFELLQEMPSKANGGKLFGWNPGALHCQSVTIHYGKTEFVFEVMETGYRSKHNRTDMSAIENRLLYPLCV